MPVVESLNHRLRGDWTGFLRSYLVPSVIPPGRSPRSWLVCESPHVVEVRERCPLVGRTGETVTRALVSANLLQPCCDAAVGALIQTGAIDWLGIINASELPLQWHTYAQQLIASERAPPDALGLWDWAILMLAFDKVRRYGPHSRMPCQNSAEFDLLEDFRTRIRREVSDGHRILLCGNVAQAFWALVGSDGVATWPVLHPAARRRVNGWVNDRGEDGVADALRWLAWSN